MPQLSAHDQDPQLSKGEAPLRGSDATRRTISFLSRHFLSQLCNCLGRGRSLSFILSLKACIFLSGCCLELERRGNSSHFFSNSWQHLCERIGQCTLLGKLLTRDQVRTNFASPCNPAPSVLTKNRPGGFRGIGLDQKSTRWFLNDFELLHHSVQRLFSLLWRWFLSLG